MRTFAAPQTDFFISSVVSAHPCTHMAAAQRQLVKHAHPIAPELLWLTLCCLQVMDNLLLGVGDLVNLQNVSLPKGTFIKIQPHTSDFLEISNPKAVLETSLRSFTCLTEVRDASKRLNVIQSLSLVASLAGDCQKPVSFDIMAACRRMQNTALITLKRRAQPNVGQEFLQGDTFVIEYNDKKFYIDVLKVRPDAAISVVETDVNVDFAPPKDYKEPDYKAEAAAKAEAEAKAKAALAEAAGETSAAAGDSAAAASEEPKFMVFGGAHALSTCYRVLSSCAVRTAAAVKPG